MWRPQQDEQVDTCRSPAQASKASLGVLSTTEGVGHHHTFYYRRFVCGVSLLCPCSHALPHLVPPLGNHLQLLSRLMVTLSGCVFALA